VAGGGRQVAGGRRQAAGKDKKGILSYTLQDLVDDVIALFIHIK
jgi:hypothetical protein